MDKEMENKTEENLQSSINRLISVNEKLVAKQSPRQSFINGIFLSIGTIIGTILIIFVLGLIARNEWIKNQPTIEKSIERFLQRVQTKNSPDLNTVESELNQP